MPRLLIPMIASCLVLISCRKEAEVAYEVEVLNCSSPYELQFVNASKNYDKLAWNIDGIVYQDENPIVLLEDDKEHFLSLTLFNRGKSTTHTDKFYVSDYYQLPKAKFTHYFSDCMNFKKAYFKSKSTGEIHGYHWDFGDGTTSIASSTQHIFPSAGTYTIRHSVYRCNDTVTVTKNVQIKPSNVHPDAHFTLQRLGTNAGSALLIGNKIKLTNYSDHAQNYLWRFGDGTTSTSTSPSHKYTSTGTYTIELVAICGNRRDSVTKKNNCTTSKWCKGHWHSYWRCPYK